MSSIGILGDNALATPQLTFAPARRIVAAHADHRRSDFIFQRTQSLVMRNVPWDRRIKPLRSWSEIGTYYAAAIALLAAFGVMTALI